MDQEYICSLDEAFVKRARKELMEDPRNRLGAVRKLREWIEQQPHITFPTGDIFFVIFNYCQWLVETNLKTVAYL